MRNRWTGYVFSLTVLTTFIAFFCGKASPAVTPAKLKAEIARLTVGLPAPSISFLPVWAIEQNGYLKDAGVPDLRILVFQGGAPMMQALASGTVDLCLTSISEVVNTITSGQKFKAVWAGYNMPYFDWYARPRFKTIAETKGGTYAVSKYGTLTDSLTRYALRSAGLDPDRDVKILQLGNQTQALAALDAGQIDAAILPSPQSYMAEEKGFFKLMSQKEQVAPDWPTHVVYTREEFISRNQNTLKAFLQANGKAIEWIKNNTDEAAVLASRKLKFKVEHCRRAIYEIRDEWYPDGRLPANGLKVFWAITVQAGDVKEPWQTDKWLDETFLKTQNEWRR